MLSGRESGGVSRTGTNSSGSDLREDGLVAFGYSAMQGKRHTMEDYTQAQFKRDPRSGTVWGFFGVFDGHGGAAAADYVRSNVFINLMQHKSFQTDLHTAIRESFVDTDNGYLRLESSANRDDGCTGVTAILVSKATSFPPSHMWAPSCLVLCAAPQTQLRSVQ